MISMQGRIYWGIGLFTQCLAAAWAAGSFTDSFDGNSLNTRYWMVCEKSWNPNSGGVVHENISVTGGLLRLEGHGDSYSGALQGVDRFGNRIERTTRVGAAIATRGYYGSGRYEVRARMPQQAGGCSAFWTYHYREAYPGDPLYTQLLAQGLPLSGDAENGYYVISNEEIDMELPIGYGDEASYQYLQLVTWLGDIDFGVYTDYIHDLGSPINDGNFHTYRFDWHTGGSGQTRRVEFYVDGQCIRTNRSNVPTVAGRFWLGLWYPTDWAGNPNYNTQVLEIDWARITPFHETNDVFTAETYPDGGWWYNPDTMLMDTRLNSQGPQLDIHFDVPPSKTFRLLAGEPGTDVSAWQVVATNLSAGGSQTYTWPLPEDSPGFRLFRSQWEP